MKLVKIKCCKKKNENKTIQKKMRGQKNVTRFSFSGIIIRSIHAVYCVYVHLNGSSLVCLSFVLYFTYLTIFVFDSTKKKHTHRKKLLYYCVFFLQRKLRICKIKKKNIIVEPNCCLFITRPT